MARIKVKTDRCKGCYLCIANCPNGLIKVSPKLNIKGVKAIFFSGGKCTGCAMCVAVCPDGVIEVVK
jgi:2-oxoglutarate ferredoxin oxidoreductase subunit delta